MMNMNDIHKINFELRDGDNFIPLISLLKAVGIAESGSMAQDVVTAGLIRRNGEIELRKRAKIISGDIIEFENYVIHIK